MKDDPGTVEQMYAVVNRKTGVVELRMPDMPNALNGITRLQTALNETRTNSAMILDFYDEEKDPAN